MATLNTHFPAPVSGAKSPYLRGPQLPPFYNTLTPNNLQNLINRGTPLNDGYLGHKPLTRPAYIINYQPITRSASILGERGPRKNGIDQAHFHKKTVRGPLFFQGIADGSLGFCAWWVKAEGSFIKFSVAEPFVVSLNNTSYSFFCLKLIKQPL